LFEAPQLPAPVPVQQAKGAPAPVQLVLSSSQAPFPLPVQHEKGVPAAVQLAFEAGPATRSASVSTAGCHMISFIDPELSSKINTFGGTC
jgi:hypothetical protein